MEVVEFDVSMGRVHSLVSIDQHRRTITFNFRHILISEGRVAHTYRPGREFAPNFGHSETHIDRLGRNARYIFDALTKLNDEGHPHIIQMMLSRHTLRVSVAGLEDCGFEESITSIATPIAQALRFGNEAQIERALEHQAA